MLMHSSYMFPSFAPNSHMDWTRVTELQKYNSWVNHSNKSKYKVLLATTAALRPPRTIPQLEDQKALREAWQEAARAGKAQVEHSSPAAKTPQLAHPRTLDRDPDPPVTDLPHLAKTFGTAFHSGHSFQTNDLFRTETNLHKTQHQKPRKSLKHVSMTCLNHLSHFFQLPTAFHKQRLNSPVENSQNTFQKLLFFLPTSHHTATFQALQTGALQSKFKKKKNYL